MWASVVADSLSIQQRIWHTWQSWRTNLGQSATRLDASTNLRHQTTTSWTQCPKHALSPLVEQNPPRDFQVSMPPVSLPQRHEVRSARPAVIFEATNLQVTATGTID